MSDLDQARWQPWIDQACAALDVGSAGVDVAAIHDLTSTIARDFVRPMAPVAAYLWGLAVAAHPDVAAEQLRQLIYEAMPRPEQE